MFSVFGIFSFVFLISVFLFCKETDQSSRKSPRKAGEASKIARLVENSSKDRRNKAKVFVFLFCFYV